MRISLQKYSLYLNYENKNVFLHPKSVLLFKIKTCNYEHYNRFQFQFPGHVHQVSGNLVNVPINAVKYYVLKMLLGRILKTVKITADDILHWFGKNVIFLKTNT